MARSPAEIKNPGGEASTNSKMSAPDPCLPAEVSAKAGVGMGGGNISLRVWAKPSQTWRSAINLTPSRLKEGAEKFLEKRHGWAVPREKSLSSIRLTARWKEEESMSETVVSYAPHYYSNDGECDRCGLDGRIARYSKITLTPPVGVASLTLGEVDWPPSTDAGGPGDVWLCGKCAAELGLEWF